MRYLKLLNEKILFSQMTPLLRLGFRRPLEAHDLPALPKHLSSREVVVKEQNIDWSTGSSFLKTLLASSKRYWLPQLGFYGLFALMNLLGPVTIHAFVERLQGGFLTPESLLETLLLAFAIGAVGLIGGLSLQHYFRAHLARHQIVTNVINKKIFTHALHLRKEARDRTPMGDIVNHMSSDTDAVAEVGNAIADAAADAKPSRYFADRNVPERAPPAPHDVRYGEASWSCRSRATAASV